MADDDDDDDDDTDAVRDPIIGLLARASLKFLSPHDFDRLWDRASKVRPEARLFKVWGAIVDPLILRTAELRALHDDERLTDFVRAWMRLRPKPEAEESKAIRLYCSMADLDLTIMDDAEIDDATKQAVLDAREAFLSDEAVYDLIRNYFPRVCCIVGTAMPIFNGLVEPKRIGGTGCLIAPDVVLTNWHVIEHLLDGNGAARPGSNQEFAVFFDHRRKETITEHNHDWPNTKRVLPAESWYLDGSKKSVQRADFSTALDYALIKLATPIGTAARDGRSGERRGWVSITGPMAPTKPQLSQALLCPQHPRGLGRVFAFGRAVGLYHNSNSRLAYSLSSAEGSSGSPVLSLDGRMIAIHEADGNGALDEDPPQKHNRGVLLDTFASLVQIHLQGVSAVQDTISSIWAVRMPENAHHPLVGRQIFLDWIEDQLKPAPTQAPIYVITGGEKSGKSFSTDILRARLENLSDTVLAFAPPGRGTDSGGLASRSYMLLPERPDELLKEIAKALKLDAEKIPQPPPEFQWRETGAGEGVAEDLKLNDWASNSLTKWLDESIAAANFDQEKRLWVVLDIPPGTPFGPGIQSFLKSASNLAVTNPHFGMIRWVYIDYDPAFIPQSGRTHEKLRPQDDITVADGTLFLERMYVAVGKEVPEAGVLTAQWNFLAGLKIIPEAFFWTMVSATLRETIELSLAEE